MTVINSYLRSSVYKELSSLHAYPEAPMQMDIVSRKEDIQSLFSDLSSQKPFSSMPSIEEILMTFEDISLANLQTEYVRLFDYHPPCGTNETYYMDPDSSDPSSIASTILGFYQDFGLNASASFQEPPDGLMHELEFMHFLAHMEGESWAAGNEKLHKYINGQKKFLGDHLMLWISKFSDCVGRHTELSFFKILSGITERFITLDYEYVCSLAAITPSKNGILHNRAIA